MMLQTERALICAFDFMRSDMNIILLSSLGYIQVTNAALFFQLLFETSNLTVAPMTHGNGKPF